MDFREITEFFKDFIGYIITLIVIILIYTFVVSFQPIAGNSMTPNLMEGDIVLVSKLSYIIEEPRRNDIIVFKTKDGKRFVKRVIGLPGEKIDYLNGIIYINDESFKETVIGEDVLTNNFMFVDICSKEKCTDSKIPENYYLVLGDNREDSQDSRDKEIGLIEKSQISGKVIFRIWPVNEMGKIT